MQLSPFRRFFMPGAITLFAVLVGIGFWVGLGPTAAFLYGIGVPVPLFVFFFSWQSETLDERLAKTTSSRSSATHSKGSEGETARGAHGTLAEA